MSSSNNIYYTCTLILKIKVVFQKPNLSDLICLIRLSLETIIERLSLKVKKTTALSLSLSLKVK